MSMILPAFKCFNPRSRVGSDFLTEGQASIDRVFQSTLPRGERLNFNSPAD